MSEKEMVDPATQIKRISRRSFLWAGAAVIGCYEAFHWLNQQPDEDGLSVPLRRGLALNQTVASYFFSPSRMSPTFKKSDITEARVNDIGLSDDFDISKWHLEVSGTGMKSQLLTLADIKKLPRHEFVTELKCIEGWSIFVQWAGALFQDFHAAHPAPPGMRYVNLETPDKGDSHYYVSIDMPAMLHPQTLLCYEMNGIPLPVEHGAPLRLVIPHKYGIKNIKRISRITYASEAGADYWAERGYDWYAGL